MPIIYEGPPTDKLPTMALPQHFRQPAPEPYEPCHAMQCQNSHLDAHAILFAVRGKPLSLSANLPAIVEHWAVIRVHAMYETFILVVGMQTGIEG